MSSSYPKAVDHVSKQRRPHFGINRGQRGRRVVNVPTMLLLLLVFHLPACCPKLRIPNEELDQNDVLWRDKKISNYNFTVSKMTMGTWSILPLVTKVRNGKRISTEVIGDPGQPMTRVESFEDFATIDKAFETIQESFNSGYSVNATYNKDLGYPEKIRLDPGPGFIDNAFIIKITDFEVVKE